MKHLLRTILFTTLLTAIFGFSILSADLALAEENTYGGSPIEVSKFILNDDNEWQSANACCDTVKIEVGETVNWKLKVKNESDQPQQVVISDKLDGQPFNLSAYCTLPTDNTIAAYDKWICEYETTAEADEHTNVLYAQIDQSNDVAAQIHDPDPDPDPPLVKKDSATYYGVEPDPDDPVDFSVTKQVKDANSDWKDADRLWDALKVKPETELSWRIQIVNNEEEPIAVSLKDMMDGAEIDISADCPGPDGGTIAKGESYVCEYSSTAKTGAHVNVIIVSATMGELVSATTVEPTEADRDAAFYVARQYHDYDDLVKVEKKVKIDGDDWQDADRMKDAVIVDAGDELQWWILAINESGKDVTLTVTDTLNGQPVDLSGCEIIPEPFTIGAEYSCEYTTIAVAGPNVNFAKVEAEVDSAHSIDRDAAMALGLPLSVQLRENLVITKEVKLDDGDWMDADRLNTALYAPVGVNLNWQITVENQNEVAATVVLTDHMDGAVFDLPDDCVLEAEMTPGATLSCSFTSIAEAGYHVNVATVFADFDGIQVGKRDAAFYTSDPAADDDRSEGCGVGFWKTHLLAWGTTFPPSDDFDITFGVESTFNATTLVGVLWQGGGDGQAFGRQAVAALLNASHPGISYDYSEAEVMELVLAAYADDSFSGATQTLDEMSDGFCPLGGYALQHPGVGKPSFWRLHRHVWPLNNLFIGHKLYTEQQVFEFMLQLHGNDDPAAATAVNDMTVELYAAVAASRLNIAAGNDGSCIESTLDAADEWLAVNPVESDVSAADDSWEEAATLLETIEAYNNGELCAAAILADTTLQIFMPMMHDLND